PLRTRPCWSDRRGAEIDPAEALKGGRPGPRLRSRPSGRSSSSALGRSLRRSVVGCLGRVLVDQPEADLAALVDLEDLDLDLVADVDDVLDLADALAAAELRDVDEAVLARKQRDERAERGRFD